MVDDCPMTEDCPAYDRERQLCLVQPGDCEFSPADADTSPLLKPSEVRTPDTAADAMAG
jgi:hypothetical protein